MNIDEVVLNFTPGSLVLLNVVLGLIMFGIALDTSLDDFKAVAKAPKAMLIALVAQLVLLPAVTFGLTLLLNVQASIALGMILVACCPPGNISQVLTYRSRGNVALSVVLLIASGLLVRSFVSLLSVDPGFTTAGVLTMEVDLSGANYNDTAKIASFYDRLIERIQALPGVDAVSASTNSCPSRDSQPPPSARKVRTAPSAIAARATTRSSCACTSVVCASFTRMKSTAPPRYWINDSSVLRSAADTLSAMKPARSRERRNSEMPASTSAAARSTVSS